MISKSDKLGYNEMYQGKFPGVYYCEDKEALIAKFEKDIQPFYAGGVTKGYVRSLSIQSIIRDCERNGRRPEEVTVLDAGCGLGALACYMAAKGFNVIGVDISEEGIKICQTVARKFDLQDHCRFIAASLGDTSLPDNSVDYVIGHGSLHHFIKYEDIPCELRRIMKPNAKGFFSDGFAENKLYHLFHDKKLMEKLGDVSLTKKMITTYFHDFQVTLIPTDWLVMLDKLILKILPASRRSVARRLSAFFFRIDRKLGQMQIAAQADKHDRQSGGRIALYLSGAVLTEVVNTKSIEPYLSDSRQDTSRY